MLARPTNTSTQNVRSAAQYSAPTQVRPDEVGGSIALGHAPAQDHRPGSGRVCGPLVLPVAISSSVVSRKSERSAPSSTSAHHRVGMSTPNVSTTPDGRGARTSATTPKRTAGVSECLIGMRGSAVYVTLSTGWKSTISIASGRTPRYVGRTPTVSHCATPAISSHGGKKRSTLSSSSSSLPSRCWIGVD